MPEDLFNFKRQREQQQTLTAKPRTDPLEQSFRTYQSDPSPANLNAAVTAAAPVIDYGVQRFGGGKSPLLSSRGRLLTVQALKTWDPKSKASPKTWTLQQLQGLNRYRSRLDPIVTPERLNQDSLLARRSTEDFSQQYGRDPSPEELSSLSGLSRKRLRAIQKVSVGRVNESQLVDDEGDRYLPGVDNDSPEAIWTEMVYSDLDDRGKQIYDLLTGRNGAKPLNITEVAQKLKVSPAAVTQRANRIREMIREGMQLDQYAMEG